MAEVRVLKGLEGGGGGAGNPGTPKVFTQLNTDSKAFLYLALGQCCLWLNRILK